MLTITPIPAFQDNYIWLLQAGEHVACVDTGDAAPVLAYLQQHRLQLSQIWLTHLHHDHTGGVAELLQAFPDCQVYGNDDIAHATHRVQEGSVIDFAHHTVQVWHTAGHTNQHLTFILSINGQHHVFCGDTLFSAGCGRVFTGTMTQLYHSIQRFQTLPTDTLFYPAHEYTAANLRFAAHIEPENPAIAAALSQAQTVPTLPVCLAHEQQINPFLRLSQPALQQRVAALSGTDLRNEADVFTALRLLKNQF